MNTLNISQSINQSIITLKAQMYGDTSQYFVRQIQSIEASFDGYAKPLADVNVLASVCVLNLRIKF